MGGKTRNARGKSQNNPFSFVEWPFCIIYRSPCVCVCVRACGGGEGCWYLGLYRPSDSSPSHMRVKENVK